MNTLEDFLLKKIAYGLYSPFSFFSMIPLGFTYGVKQWTVFDNHAVSYKLPLAAAAKFIAHLILIIVYYKIVPLCREETHDTCSLKKTEWKRSILFISVKNLFCQYE
jgi:hypothetical protein